MWAGRPAVSAAVSSAQEERRWRLVRASDAVLWKYYDRYLPCDRPEFQQNLYRWVVFSHAATLTLPDKRAAINALAGQAVAAWSAVARLGPPGLAVSTSAAIARVRLLQELFEESRPHKVFENVKAAPQLLSRSVDLIGIRTPPETCLFDHLMTLTHP